MMMIAFDRDVALVGPAPHARRRDLHAMGAAAAIDERQQSVMTERRGEGRLSGDTGVRKIGGSTRRRDRSLVEFTVASVQRGAQFLCFSAVWEVVEGGREVGQRVGVGTQAVALCS